MKITILNTRYGFKLLVIDCTKGGTHSNYNVLFNSDCQNIFFTTYDEAFSQAMDILININK